MKIVKDCITGIRAHIKWVAAIMAVVLVVSWMSAINLPSPRQYECRYEMRLRNFFQNTTPLERVLTEASDLPITGFKTYVDNLYGVHDGVVCTIGANSKLTICVRNANKDTAFLLASDIYNSVVDTVGRFAGKVRRMKDTLYTHALSETSLAISQLQPISRIDTVMADSLAAALFKYTEVLRFLRCDTTPQRYVVLLNNPSIHTTQLTPSRLAVVLMSELAALFLVVAYFFMAALNRVVSAMEQSKSGKLL